MRCLTLKAFIQHMIRNFVLCFLNNLHNDRCIFLNLKEHKIKSHRHVRISRSQIYLSDLGSLIRHHQLPTSNPKGAGFRFLYVRTHAPHFLHSELSSADRRTWSEGSVEAVRNLQIFLGIASTTRLVDDKITSAKPSTRRFRRFPNPKILGDDVRSQLCAESHSKYRLFTIDHSSNWYLNRTRKDLDSGHFYHYLGQRFLPPVLNFQKETKDEKVDCNYPQICIRWHRKVYVRYIGVRCLPFICCIVRDCRSVDYYRRQSLWRKSANGWVFAAFKFREPLLHRRRTSVLLSS